MRTEGVVNFSLFIAISYFTKTIRSSNWIEKGQYFSLFYVMKIYKDKVDMRPFMAVNKNKVGKYLNSI